MILARIVDMLDQINNHGKPMEDYTFWPDVLDGLKGGRAFYMLHVTEEVDKVDKICIIVCEADLEVLMLFVSMLCSNVEN